MRGTFMGIETARRSIQVHRLSMDITNHNIANANTEGYSRQQAVASASEPYANVIPQAKMTYGQVGTGVDAKTIRRVRDEYLEIQVRDSASGEAFWQNQFDICSRLEAVFPEPAAPGIQEIMVRFFNNWQALNNTPQDPGIMAAVWETGEELAIHFNETYTQLKNIYNTVTNYDHAALATEKAAPITSGSIADSLQRINHITRDIIDLNNSIKKVIDSGNQPNDLRDRRDVLLRELAGYGPISTEQVMRNGKLTGEVTVSFLGINIVNNNGSATEARTLTSSIEQVENPDTGDISEEVFIIFGGGEKTSLTQKVLSEETGGLLGYEKARQRANLLMKQLDTLVNSLKNSINDIKPLHREGVDFFTGNGAADVKLGINASDIDGTKALRIVQLRDQKNTGGTTFLGYYGQMLASLGAEVHSAAQRVKSQESIGNQIKSLIESLSGVSLDEELSKVIQFQQGYNASAKLMSVMNEMLETLINRM